MLAISNASMLEQKLGHYRIEERIDAGGIGEVFRATDTQLEREVAIKVLPEDFAHDPARISRFKREAPLLASLNHPNIATLHGFEVSGSGDTHFLVMELIPGETLQERLTRGPIPLAEVVPLFVQMSEALEAAHEKGIVHRDLKPANVKILPDGQVRVLDFGLVKAVLDERPTSVLSQSQSQSPTATRARRPKRASFSELQRI